MISVMGRRGLARAWVATSFTVAVWLMPAAGAAQPAGAAGSRPEIEGEWKSVGDKYERRIAEHRRRIARIAERGGPVRADGRTPNLAGDRVAALVPTMKRDGDGKRLARLAEEAMRDPAKLAELYKAQEGYLETVMGQWGEDGLERKRTQEAVSALAKNIEQSQLSFEQASEAIAAADTLIRQSGVLDKATRTSAATKEAAERLTARWERERIARERERDLREREAAERARARP
jgi:hypothetical protein